MRSRYTSKTRAAEAITEIDMKIGVLGLGYVGLANVGVLASIGHQVVGYDINKEGSFFVSRFLSFRRSGARKSGAGA